jgi:hypothetical protein
LPCKQKTNSLGVLLYSSLGTMPTAFAMAILVGEVDSIVSFPHLFDPVRGTDQGSGSVFLTALIAHWL